VLPALSTDDARTQNPPRRKSKGTAVLGHRSWLAEGTVVDDENSSPEMPVAGTPALKLTPSEGCFGPWDAVEVTWKTIIKTDVNPHYRLFDFLVLHKFDDPPEKFISSLFMLGELDGDTEFVMPHEAGIYRISAVRDFTQTLECVMAARKDPDIVKLAYSYGRHKFALLGQTGAIVVKGTIMWVVNKLVMEHDDIEKDARIERCLRRPRQSFTWDSSKTASQESSHNAEACKLLCEAESLEAAGQMQEAIDCYQRAAQLSTKFSSSSSPPQEALPQVSKPTSPFWSRQVKSPSSQTESGSFFLKGLNFG